MLYGTDPVIDLDNGCGHCVRSYLEGMPAFSLRGSVLDLGDGKFETSSREDLQSEVRRMCVGHDVTESAEIRGIWAEAVTRTSQLVQRIGSMQYFWHSHPVEAL